MCVNNISDLCEGREAIRGYIHEDGEKELERRQRKVKWDSDSEVSLCIHTEKIRAHQRHGVKT
jgi:hypothetical protein